MEGAEDNKVDSGMTTLLPTTDFEHLRKEHVRPLIELNDRINALTATETRINSTRIVVAGDQSHGKTSLLEALSGVDLPRGEDIATRVPLILQLRGGLDEGKKDLSVMIKVPSEDGGNGEVEIGTHQINDKIKEFTERIAGPGKDVQNKPIELKIFRNDQQDDLTLVDLPGITRVALEDQAGGNDQALEKRILDMCREYMAPEESILLNVVNAMVDFTTSASLALSRELDPKGERTLLCITKVDQYTDVESFHRKIMKAISSMKLKPENVFCVRNRSERENRELLSLEKVRQQEMELLNKLTNQQVVEYQLGVRDLSKALVERQSREIQSTLPVTLKKIQTLEEKLESRYMQLGEPLEDAGTCRAHLIRIIDQYDRRLQDEISGQISTKNVSDNWKGRCFEISLTLLDLKSRLAHGEDVEDSSEKLEAGECTFILKAKSTKEEEGPNDNGAERSNHVLGAYLYVNLGEKVESMNAVFTFTAFPGSTDARIYKTRQVKQKFEEKSSNIGYANLGVPPEALENISEATVTVSVFITDISFAKDYSSFSRRNSLLCSRLADLQNTFTSEVDELYSNQYFFSVEFRKSLESEVSACRGGIGLPGSLPSHVPCTVLEKLRKQLPFPINSFRKNFYSECLESVELIMEQYVDLRLTPRLHSLTAEVIRDHFKDCNKKLEEYHKTILDWETGITTTNHYFMDTVRSIRSQIYSKDSKKSQENDIDNNGMLPSYLKHLRGIRKMSNEEQKLIDWQIEIFAYWKLLKKRLVDYVILSTHCELAKKPLTESLKPLLLERVFNQDNDDKLIGLMKPADYIVTERASIEERLGKLRQAASEIHDFQYMIYDIDDGNEWANNNTA